MNELLGRVSSKLQWGGFASCWSDFLKVTVDRVCRERVGGGIGGVGFGPPTQGMFALGKHFVSKLPPMTNPYPSLSRPYLTHSCVGET